MSEKPKRKAKSPTSYLTRFILILLGVVGGSILLCAGIVYFIFSEMSLEGTRAIARIEDLLDVEMPPSSTNIFFEDSTFGNNHWLPEIRFRFTAPASEIETWLHSDKLCFELPLQTIKPFEPQELDTAPEWYQPHLLDTVAQGGCFNVDSPFHNHVIQIDQTNPEYWTVYFELWFY